MKLVTFILGAAMMAAPLHAQTEPEAQTGSRLKAERKQSKTNSKSYDRDETRRVAKRFGRCLFDRRKEQSIKLLSVSDYLTIDYGQLGEAEYLLTNRILMEDCLGRAGRSALRGIGMTISNTAIRTALVEEAYLDIHRDENEPISIDPDAPEVLPNRYLVPGNTHEDARATASFADCVVYQAPSQAHAILHTKPTTAEEKEAVMAIVPAVGRCIPDGKEMRLDVASIRAIVADGLWARSYYGSMSEAGGE